MICGRNSTSEKIAGKQDWAECPDMELIGRIVIFCRRSSRDDRNIRHTDLEIRNWAQKAIVTPIFHFELNVISNIRDVT